MKKIFQNPVATFLFCMVAVCTILLIVPINLFDGEVVFSPELHLEPQPTKLSLSDFTGLWTTEADLEGVADFYLTGMGWFMVFLMVVGLPALIAYRVRLAQKPPKQ